MAESATTATLQTILALCVEWYNSKPGAASDSSKKFLPLQL